MAGNLFQQLDDVRGGREHREERNHIFLLPQPFRKTLFRTCGHRVQLLDNVRGGREDR